MAFERLKEHFDWSHGRVGRRVMSSGNDPRILSPEEYTAQLESYRALYDELHAEGKKVSERRWSGKWGKKKLVPGQYHFLLFRDLLGKETKGLRKAAGRWQKANRADYDFIDKPLTDAEQGSRDAIASARQLLDTYSSITQHLISESYSPKSLFFGVSDPRFSRGLKINGFLTEYGEVERDTTNHLRRVVRSYDGVDVNVSQPGNCLTDEQLDGFKTRAQNGRRSLDGLVGGLENEKLVPDGITDRTTELVEVVSTLRNIDKLEGMLGTLDKYDGALKRIVQNLSGREPIFEIPGDYYTTAKPVDVTQAKELIPGERFSGARKYYLDAVQKFGNVNQRKTEIQTAYYAACDNLVTQAAELNATTLQQSYEISDVRARIELLKGKISKAVRFSLPQIVADTTRVQNLADLSRELGEFDDVLTQTQRSLRSAGDSSARAYSREFDSFMRYLDGEWNSDGPDGSLSSDDLNGAIVALRKYNQATARPSAGSGVDPRVSALYGERQGASADGIDPVKIEKLKTYVAQAYLANAFGFRDAKLIGEFGIDIREYTPWQRPAPTRNRFMDD
jgi:hypothetical protein